MPPETNRLDQSCCLKLPSWSFQWFCKDSPKSVVLNWGRFCSPEHIFQCPEALLIVQSRDMLLTTSESLSADKYPKVHKIAPHNTGIVKPPKSVTLKLRNSALGRIHLNNFI